MIDSELDGSFRNRDEILESTLCGCFSCLKTFVPTQVKEWIDGGQTAICPFCSVDSVLGNRHEDVSVTRLQALNQKWFNNTDIP